MWCPSRVICWLVPLHNVTSPEQIKGTAANGGSNEHPVTHEDQGQGSRATLDDWEGMGGSIGGGRGGGLKGGENEETVE